MTAAAEPIRLLVADDQPDVLESLLLLFKGVGYRAEVVSSPSGILTALESQDFDLLLFDYSWGDYGALRFLFGPGTRNLLGHADSRIANTITRARATADPAARQDLVLAAQREVLEDVLWRPLVVRRITVAVDGRCLAGERQAADGSLSFTAARTR